jgi:hypothetical protein
MIPLDQKMVQAATPTESVGSDVATETKTFEPQNQ